MKTSHLAAVLVLILLPLSQAYGQGGQCSDVQTQGLGDLGGTFTFKFDFGDSTCTSWGCVKFEVAATSDPESCEVSAQACALQPKKLDAAAYDCGAESCPAIVTELPTIETECQLYDGHRKCIKYTITHDPTCQPTDSTGSFDTWIYANPDLQQAAGSPRVCACPTEDPTCQSQLPTANITGLYPGGNVGDQFASDPIRSKIGSSPWWCHEVQGTGEPAVFGGWQLPTSCHVDSTCPLKFTLFDTFGAIVDDGKVLLSIQQISPCNNGFCPVLNLASPGSAETPPFFRFTTDHWQFNWIPQDPPGPGVYQVTAVFLSRNVPEESAIVCVDAEDPRCL